MTDWIDDLESALARHDDCGVMELVRHAPEEAPALLAEHLDRCVEHEAEVDAAGLSKALMLLMHHRGDAEATRLLTGEDSPWLEAARVALERPSRWAPLVESTPGATPVDRCEVALRRLLLHGVTFEAVVARLAHNGPGPELDAIACTGLLSQFHFSDRADRARRLDRRIVWTKLAMFAAQARGHLCCAGPFRMELEALLSEWLGAPVVPVVPSAGPVAEA